MSTSHLQYVAAAEAELLRKYVQSAEPNRRKLASGKANGHVTMLAVANPDREISAVRFRLCVVAERYIL